MRTKIKKVAARLLIKHGYRGVSFGDIAAQLGTTRANLHYHFGTKQKLVDEVVDEYVADTLGRFREIWTDRHASVLEKIQRTTEFNRRRYRRFNRGSQGSNSWSLIARLRQDSDALSASANRRLKEFGVELHAMISEAVAAAKGQGELAPDTPVDDVALQLSNIVNIAGPITQDAGGFERLERLYRAFANVVAYAYGRERDAATSIEPPRSAAGGPG
jgi:AcrR family transcriptional regulator